MPSMKQVQRQVRQGADSLRQHNTSAPAQDSAEQQESRPSTTVSLTAAIQSVSNSCKAMKNPVILYICCSLRGSSEQLHTGMLQWGWGEDLQGGHSEHQRRKHMHRHGPCHNSQ